MVVKSKSEAVVLVIDDEPAIRKLLRLTLEPAGYAVRESETGQGGLAEAAYLKPDIIVLDLGLPDMDGLQVLERLREWSAVPVLILSVREDVGDKVAALDGGASDYLQKPFHAAELVARLRAILRHARRTEEDPVYRVGALEVDLVKRAVRVDTKDVHLTATEYALLKTLIHHRGKVVTHAQLLREVWGPEADDRAQYLRVYVNRLRKKIHPHPDSVPAIRNEPGIGYRLTEERG